MASFWISIVSILHLACPTAVANAHARGNHCEGGLCQASGHSLLQRTNFEHQQPDVPEGMPPLEIQPIPGLGGQGEEGSPPPMRAQPIEEPTPIGDAEGPSPPVRAQPIEELKPIKDTGGPPVKITPIKPEKPKPEPINDAVIKPIIEPINDASKPVIKPIIGVPDLDLGKYSLNGSNGTNPEPAPEPEPTPSPNRTGLPCPDNSTNFSIPKVAMKEFEKSCHTHLNESLKDMEKDMEKDVQQQPDIIGVLLKMCEEGTPEHAACFGQLIDYFEDCNVSDSNITNLKEGLEAMCKLVELLSLSMGSSSMPNMSSIEDMPDQMS